MRVVLQDQRVIFSVIVCIIRGIMARFITGFSAGIVAGIIKTNIEAILAVIIVGKNGHFQSINPNNIISVINVISLNLI